MNDFTLTKGRLIAAFPALPPGDKAFTLPEHLEGPWRAFGAALRVPEQLAEHAQAVKRDPKLSDVGKKAALKDWAVENAAPALRQALAALSDADAQRAAIKSRMAEGVIDKSDFAAAIVRSDIRTWLRTLKPSERAALLAMEPDPQIAAAVIEAPPALSGTLPRQRERLAEAAAAARYPVEAKQLSEIDQAAEAIGSAWKVAQKAIEAEAGRDALRAAEAAAGLPNARDEILKRVSAELGPGAQEAS